MARPIKMRKILVRDFNDLLLCTLCNGYLIDATSLTECHHIFCRGCILRYFENKPACPTCNFMYKKKNQQQFFKLDLQLQTLVYKMVPGLFSKEMQRREDFYRSTGVRASSSCSDDSVFEQERDEDTMVVMGNRNQFIGAEDSISLSLEYYQKHLDTSSSDCAVTNSDKRFLQCPAGVSMKHLQKFIRMKYALTLHHQVDIIYKGEVLPLHFTLMDVGYSFKWKRQKPLRFFYRIFTPLKIQPIRIVNTTLSSGDKLLQVVAASKATTEIKEENNEEKERLLAHLQLQSKAKVVQPPASQDCIFDYEEPDKEEIKRFAEIRDREWALQKKLDESREREKDDEYHHFSKKRKKSKHSKNDFTYKKRKLHAEITNKEEELKLKVKLTPHNGHKHKHHKSTNSEMSSKERLLQMRQIRHKNIEEKTEEVKPTSNGTVKTDKIATVQIERNEQTELQAKKTVLKTISEKNLERKIANLQQRCTVETKPMEKKVVPQFGVTVSKVENNSKRKEEEDSTKRPSLEITLVTPSEKPKPVVKRPLPDTIPLERIKKSLNFKSGISIIPKVPEKCDNIGALDLSAKTPTDGQVKPGGGQINMSNLQMLSKVAAEHPTLKPKPKIIPQLQAIRIPTPNQRVPPNLTKIDQTQFRMIRNLRPNQNQSIRNIPNPSLLVRQQQQNRLISLNSTTNSTDSGTKEVDTTEAAAV